MSNPLVAQEDHDTTGYAGIGILDSTTQCVDAIASGDWIGAGIGVASTIVDEFSSTRTRPPRWPPTASAG
jgi:hypothetical protein